MVPPPAGTHIVKSVETATGAIAPVRRDASPRRLPGWYSIQYTTTPVTET